MFKDEKIIEIKTCKSCSAKFEITNKDLEFYEKISPIFAGKKYLIPSPTFCPDCRQQRRLAWRNRRNIYKRNCDSSGKSIISAFSPDKPYKVYHTKIWENDSFNPLKYGKDFDFKRTFFEQFNELLLNVPLPHLAIIESTLENSEYVNGAGYVKNSYLCNNIVHSENSLYSEDIYHSNTCVDCFAITKCESCYECVSSINLFDCKYCYECEDSNNLENCSFCKSCSFCIGCIGLDGKKYHIFNKEYSQEEFNKLKSILSKKEIIESFKNLSTKFHYRYAKIINSQNVYGDNIINSKDCINSFDIRDSENIKHSIFIVDNSKDCYDLSFWGQNISLCYEGSAIGLNSSNVLFSAETYDNIKNAFYCFFCYPNSSNIFGCIGVKNQEYCILNKKYSREEYEELVPKIIEHMQKTGEWGEFFPANISPFGYNETLANRFFPINPPVLSDTNLDKRDSQSGAKAGKFKWSTYEPPFPKVDKIIKASMLPENISDIPDDILNWAIECEVSGKPFRIVKTELDFYRKHNLPIPKKHPDERYLERFSLRNPKKLFDRNCDKCGIEIKTTYSPDRKEIVYCLSCYEKEVY